MSKAKYNLYTKFTPHCSEVQVGEYSDKQFANSMLNKAVSIWGYGKLTYTTKNGIEVIKIKRKKLYYNK